MATKIPPIEGRFSLKGVEETAGKLAALGRKGERVGERMSRSFNRTTRSVRRLGAAVSKGVVRSLGKIAVNAVSRLRGEIVALGAAAAGAVGVYALFRSGSETARQINEVADAASRMGASVGEVSRLMPAFRQVGVEAEEAASGIATIGERIVEAAVLGETTATEAFGLANIDPKSLVQNPETLDGYRAKVEELEAAQAKAERRAKRIKPEIDALTEAADQAEIEGDRSRARRLRDEAERLREDAGANEAAQIKRQIAQVKLQAQQNTEMKSSVEVTRILADRFSEMENRTLRTKIGFDLMSDDFAKLIPVLENELFAGAEQKNATLLPVIPGA